MTDDREVWERRHGEPTRAYSAFRLFRDLPPTQREWKRVAELAGRSSDTMRAWGARWDWEDRATAWDDACHDLEDRERLEAIRAMHASHRTAAQTAIDLAVQGMAHLDPADMPPTLIARLLELGAKLERSTLLTSVEELQGLERLADEDEDPWDRIARELDPTRTE